MFFASNLTHIFDPIIIATFAVAVLRYFRWNRACKLWCKPRAVNVFLKKPLENDTHTYLREVKVVAI